MLLELNGHSVILWEIEVRKDYRHKGVASLLHSRLESDMKIHGDNSICLFFNRDTTLDTFYEKLGYSICRNLNTGNKDVF